jgi:hypothetical protein
MDLQDATTKTSQSDAPEGLPMVAAPECPDFRRLTEEIESAMAIVQSTSDQLARTTLLTWLYRDKGRIRFVDLISRMTTEKSSHYVQKMLRRNLRSMHRIGIITVWRPEGQAAAADAREKDSVLIDRHTWIMLSSTGIVWLHRAWRARLRTMRAHLERLSEIHEMYLDEEEEGRGADSYWVERFVGDGLGQDEQGPVTGWMGAGVNSVFGLAASIRRT